MVWGTVNLNTGEKKQGKKKEKGCFTRRTLKLYFQGSLKGKHTHTHTLVHTLNVSLYLIVSLFSSFSCQQLNNSSS